MFTRMCRLLPKQHTFGIQITKYISKRSGRTICHVKLMNHSIIIAKAVRNATLEFLCYEQ